MNKKQVKSEKLALIKSYIAPDPSSINMLTTKGFIQDLIHRTKTVDMSGMGAQLAYFFLLSFFPMLIFMVTLLPYLNLEQGQIFDFMSDIMPEEVYGLIEGTLTDVLNKQNGGLLSIGILGTIWSASKGVDALMKALNRAYDVERKAGILNRIWSLIFTISLVAVILIALVLPIFGHQIGNVIFSYIGVEKSFEIIWTSVRWIIPPVLILIVLTVMYWIVPNTDPRLTIISVFPGASFAMVGWLALTYGFSFYINNFGNYSATYGSIGGVIILMLWLYFTGMILIFGGLLNASFQKWQLAKKSNKSRKSPVF
ncbi:ribonuclease [Lysinibacillus sp. 2017]|uniref:YihY/virulence factor BrkB family protein n=1 Tax=unclassified Lysinibacillus TaxID=2636778 RepID=UPI000D528877|nr:MULTISPECIES: YihY/virulence factor BrkB family protein [unclassified Lysinibacillus]AWE08750.1 ribonuclease [Lysinibacillus sp. 2017]TGN36072.1 YihY/virulence factor BrkB family protein [Lysinibacillus sp. S2017]